MKRALSLMALAAVLGFVTLAVGASAPEDVAGTAPTVAVEPGPASAPAPEVLATPALPACAAKGETSVAAEPPLGAEAMQTLPPCSNYQGKPCNTTTKRRCLHIPGEPGICVCQSGTWQCF